MKTTAATEATDNVITLPAQPKAKTSPPGFRQRFKIIPFVNRAGSQSWRVSGTDRHGKQIRENFSDAKAAECRQVELTTEYLARETNTSIQATKLTQEQIAIAEAAFLRLDADQELLPAVEFWIKNGRQQVGVKETPRLDEAVDLFKKWLEETDSLRKRSKDFLRTQIQIFGNSVPNLRVSDISPETIDAFLETRKGSAQTRINSRLVVSRFFSWCMKGKDRRWVIANPCKAVEVEKNRKEARPEVLTVKECKDLLGAAETFQEGRLAPYVAVCLFGGLRPTEAQRLTWNRVNLADGEITVQSQASKTNKPRVVKMDETLRAWLAAYENKPFNPANRRRHFDALKQLAGFIGRTEEEEKELKPWPSDVMRHTAISHFFRKTGSYGLAAEQFGNSEYIIKRHYQGLVSSEETQKFYALKPRK